jgi:hypothetical protein
LFWKSSSKVLFKHKPSFVEVHIWKCLFVFMGDVPESQISRWLTLHCHWLESKPAESISMLHSRFARWFVFEPKISNGVNFGGSCNGKYWYIFWPFGIFCC